MSDRQQVTNAKGERIAIVAGLRTPFAKQATAFHGVSALDMGKMDYWRAQNSILS